jgi:myosin heavy subunit
MDQRRKKGFEKKKSGVAGDSLWTKFKNQLNALMTSLSITESRYIRCVKPNTLKQKCVMQHMTTIEQLRCAGVVAAVTISRSAFPNRLTHKGCIDRFRVLSKEKKVEGAPELEPKDEIVKMLTPPMGFWGVTMASHRLLEDRVYSKWAHSNFSRLSV